MDFTHERIASCIFNRLWNLKQFILALVVFALYYSCNLKSNFILINMIDSIYIVESNYLLIIIDRNKR